MTWPFVYQYCMTGVLHCPAWEEGVLQRVLPPIIACSNTTDVILSKKHMQGQSSSLVTPPYPPDTPHILLSCLKVHISQIEVHFFQKITYVQKSTFSGWGKGPHFSCQGPLISDNPTWRSKFFKDHM